LQHALLVQNRQAGGGQAPHRIGLRAGFLSQQLGGNDARGIAHPLDLDVRVGLFKGLLVGLELFGFEGRVHGQFGLGCERINAKSGEDCSGKSKRLEHGAVPFGVKGQGYCYGAGAPWRQAWERRSKPREARARSRDTPAEVNRIRVDMAAAPPTLPASSMFSTATAARRVSGL